MYFNGLDQASEEADILRCIAKEMDSIADADYRFLILPQKPLTSAILPTLDQILRQRDSVDHNFWKRNGLHQASEEADILRCIAKEMDSIADADYREDMQRLLAFYKVNQEQLNCCIEHDKKGFAPPCFLFDPYPQFLLIRTSSHPPHMPSIRTKIETQNWG